MVSSSSGNSIRAVALLDRAEEPAVGQEFVAESELGESEIPAFMLHRPHKAGWRYVAGVAAALVGVSLAALCLLPGHHMAGMVDKGVALPGSNLAPKQFLGKPAQKPSKFISMASEEVVDNIICDKYPYFKLLEVTSSNLGGHGPDGSAPEGIVYQVQNVMTNELMELHLSAVTEYFPEIVNFNGCAGLKRLTGTECHDRFGAFNLKAGTETEFTLTFHDPNTKEPIDVHHAAITWFDIDENKAHTNRESVSMAGFQDFKLEGVTNVSTSVNGSMTTWMSTSYGDGHNNPIGPAGLTPEQKQLSVTVFYDDVNSMKMKIGAGAGGVDEDGTEIKAMPRFFTFILMPSIPCARTLLPALGWKGPNEAPVQAEGEFYKWKKNVGDPVKPGDVIALIRTKDGIQNVLAPSNCNGYIEKRQPFHMGDIMEERMEKEPIAVCASGTAPKSSSLLPALPVGDGQVAVPEDGMFVNWTLPKGTPVQEGDVIGYKNITDEGPTVPILATYAGTLTDMQPFKAGQVMEDVMEDQPVAVITSIGTLPRAHSDVPVPIPDSDDPLLFVEYLKEPGDPVKEGDVIANLKKKGTIVPVHAPKDGFVKSRQTLTKDADVKKLVPDGNLAVIEDEVRLMPLSDEVADCVESEQEGVLFKKFLVDVRQEVTVGTPIAMVTDPDGTDKLLFASRTGVVKALQGLEEGDDLGKVMFYGDQCIATIRPHVGDAQSEDVYTTLAPNNFPNHTIFEEWKVRDGAWVNMGDLVANVKPPTGDYKALREVYAPTSGWVKLADLTMSDDMQADSFTISSPSEEKIEINMDVSGLDDGTKLKQWHVAVGDKVRPGDKLATVSAPGGHQQMITAFRGGWVAEVADLSPGDDVKGKLGRSDFAKVVSTPGKPGAHYYPVDVSLLPAGTTFQEFMVEEGDEVKRLDPVARVKTPEGKDVILTAGHDGVISELTNVADYSGSSLTDMLPMNVHSVATVLVEKVSEGAARPGGGEMVKSKSTCIHAVPGDLLVMWYRSETDPVSQGNTVVTVQRGGEEIELKAPREGLVSYAAKVEDGNSIDEDAASPIACIQDPKVTDTEVQGAKGEEGDIFVTWVEQVDDFVNHGDTVAVVQRDGRHTPIKAGTTGKVVFEQPLKPGDSLEADEVDPMFLIKPLIPPFKETGGSTQPTNKLVSWEKWVGQQVKRGDTVAIVEEDGKEIEVIAPQDGEISFQQEIAEGDEIPEDKASPLFLIENPHPLAAKITGASAAPEDKFMSWEKSVGDPVEEGDVVAKVLRDGEVVEVKAPRDGHVYFEQPLKAGDRISDPDHSPLFQVEGADPVGSTAQAQAAEPSDILVEWRHQMGDRVEKDDIVAVVTRNGKQVPVQAPKEGWVSYTAPVNAGEKLTDENSNPLFSVDDGPYSPLPEGTGQSTQPGDKLLRWHFDVGDPVMKGALVATIDRNGVEIPVYAPKDGDMTFKQPVEAGQEITPENSNPLFIVTERPDDLPQGVAVEGKPGDKFLEWKKNVPDSVGKGDIVAVVERDGERIELPAPNGGHVSFKQPLNPGDEIDSNTDSPLFLVDPRGYGAEGDGAPVTAPNAKKLGYSFIRFKNWAVSVGDRVEAGDVVATVELVPAGAERRRLSQSGRRLSSSLLPKEIQVLSPIPGCVRNEMDLHQGDKLEDNYASLEMAKIGWCPFHWSLWILLLLFLICCCLCCCAFVAMKKRREEKYSTMKPIGDTAAVATGKKPKFDKPDEPVTFDFQDHEGRIHSYQFTHRPLGIVYEKDHSPVKVQRCKFNSYARWMGVKDGWIIKKILKTDVTYKSVEEVEELTYSYLRDKPIWPLRLDFKTPLPKNAPVNPYSRETDGYARKSVSFMVNTQPIGIEFNHRLPMIISKVYPNTYASDHGIREQWKLIGIGYNSSKDEALLDLEEDPEELDYKDIMRKFRDGVSLLDLREDNHDILTNRQVLKWEENLGEELTGHTNHHTNHPGHGSVGRSSTSKSRTDSKQGAVGHSTTNASSNHAGPL